MLYLKNNQLGAITGGFFKESVGRWKVRVCSCEIDKNGKYSVFERELVVHDYSLP